MTLRSHRKLKKLCIGPMISIRAAVAAMDENRLGIILVVDEDRKLIGTVTDGDIRRAVLARLDFEKPVSILLTRKKGTRFEHPVTAPATAKRSELLNLFKGIGVLHIPLIDKKDRVAGLVALDDLVENQNPLRALVMAGGRGSRLMPLTKNTPKPMLRVGGKPLMEIILRQLEKVGIKKVHVSTHHRAEKITEHFGNGKKLGIELDYVNEDTPLGTAGAAGLLEDDENTTLVMNGDVLTDIDFRAMLRFHREMRADLTVAVRQYDVKVPFGIIETEGAQVKKLTEKPTFEFFVSAGIYLLEPSARRLIPKNERCDMTELIERLISDGRPVASFPIREYWLDIGQHEDYLRAQEIASRWKAAKK